MQTMGTQWLCAFTLERELMYIQSYRNVNTSLTQNDVNYRRQYKITEILGRFV